MGGRTAVTVRRKNRSIEALEHQTVSRAGAIGVRSEVSAMTSREQHLQIGRKRVEQVFRFLEALNQHRNPAIRRLDEQPWHLWFRTQTPKRQTELFRYVGS